MKETKTMRDRDNDRPYGIVRFILTVIAVFFAVCLFNALRSTAVNFGDLKEQGVELISETPGSFVKSLALFVIGFAVVYLILKAVQKKTGAKRTRIAVCLVFFALAIAAVFVFQYVPVADQILVSDCASQLNAGNDTSLLLSDYGYLIAHQNQIGLVNLLRVFYALFGDHNYLSFQIFNAVLACIGICWCGTKMTLHAAEDERVLPVYESLILTCLPLIIYVPYLYNDLISTSLVMIAFCLFAVDEGDSKGMAKSWKRVVLSDLIIGFAVVLRSNALIPAIAMILVILFQRNGNRKNKVLQIVLLIGIVYGMNVLSRLPYHAYLSGIPSIPSLAYIAMGMQGRGGGFNGFNAELYWSSGADAAVMHEKCVTAIESSIAAWKADPEPFRTFVDFKFQSQWNAPVYECLEMVLYTAGGENAIVTSLQNGVLRRLVQSFMKGFQVFYYAALVSGTWQLRKKDGILSVLAYTIFSGFLFSMLWEAKARYILPYLIYGLPLAAIGLKSFFRFLSIRVTGNNQRS